MVVPQGLAKASAVVSGIVQAPIELVWDIASRFTRFSDWVLPSSEGVRASCQVMPGGPPEYAVGCVRIMSLGENSYAERLLGIDNKAHRLRWELISIPGATNPFEGSFLNNRCSLELRPVSLDSTTYVEWTADWHTEPEAVEVMEAALEDWLASGIKGLNLFCSTKHKQTLAQTRGLGGANSPSIGNSMNLSRGGASSAGSFQGRWPS